MPETACLHIQSDPDDPIRVVPLAGVSVRIGRASYCDVRLGGPDMAQEVCRLRRRGGTWHLIPVQTSGAVSIDGRTVETSCPLPFDIPFRVGDHWLTLRSSDDSAPEWRSYQAPQPLGLPFALSAEVEGRRADRNAALDSNDDGPRTDPDAGPDRLGWLQARQEQREDWLRSRQEEQGWQERWRAAGDRLRGRAGAPETPRPAIAPSPTTTEYRPPRPDPVRPAEIPRRAVARRAEPADPRPPERAPRGGSVETAAFSPVDPECHLFSPQRAQTWEVPANGERVSSAAALLVAEPDEDVPVEESSSALAEDATAGRSPETGHAPDRDAGAAGFPAEPDRPARETARKSPDVRTPFRLPIDPASRATSFRTSRRKESDPSGDRMAARLPTRPGRDLPYVPKRQTNLEPPKVSSPAAGAAYGPMASLSPQQEAVVGAEIEVPLQAGAIPDHDPGLEVKEIVPSDDPLALASLATGSEESSAGDLSVAIPTEAGEFSGPHATVAPPRIMSATGPFPEDSAVSVAGEGRAPETLVTTIAPESWPSTDRSPFITDTWAVEPSTWTEPAPTSEPDSSASDAIAAPPRTRSPGSGGRTRKTARSTAVGSRQMDRSSPTDSGRPEASAPPGTHTVPPAEEPEWPSVRDILLARHARVDRTAPDLRRTPSGPVPTVGEAPSHWSLPLWLGWLPTTAATLAIGTAGIALAWTWSRDAFAAGQVANRLASADGPVKPLPEGIALGGTTWWRTSAGSLAQWALYAERAADPDRAGVLWNAARQAAPMHAAARFALARSLPGSGGPEGVVGTLGLSRDVVTLAWTGHQCLLAGKKEAAIRAYRAALEMASRAEPSRLAPPKFNDDPQVRRYALPYEELIGAVVRDMADGAWGVSEWSEALPRFAVAPLVASRLLRDRGNPGAEKLLDDLLAASALPPPEGSPAAIHLAAQAEAFSLKGRWTEAEERYRRAIALMSEDAVRRTWSMNLAEIALRLNDDAKRLQALNAARGDSNDEITRRAVDLLSYSGIRPEAPESRAVGVRAPTQAH